MKINANFVIVSYDECSYNFYEMMLFSKVDTNFSFFMTSQLFTSI